jgi:hypothetical protein
MNMDFADAMRAATQLTRAQKLVEATRVIQSALLGREQVPSEPPSQQAVTGRAIEKRIVDLTSEVTGPEITETMNCRLVVIAHSSCIANHLEVGLPWPTCLDVVKV